MATSAPFDHLKTVEQFYTMVKSLREFDKIEVKGVVDTLLSKTDRDQCFIGTYYRAIANVETLLTMKSAKDAQAIAMLARGLFELAVDIRLIDVIQDGAAKMIAFCDVEKLRAARKIVAFQTANPNASVTAAIYQSFIASEEQRIKADRARLWPTLTKARDLKHWSGLDLAARVDLLRAPFDEIYNVNYPQLSWYVHSGLTGIINLQAQSFTLMCGIAFKLSADSYQELLRTMIREFKIGKATEKIEEELTKHI
jgi:hypothetical protein